MDVDVGRRWQSAEALAADGAVADAFAVVSVAHGFFPWCFAFLLLDDDVANVLKIASQSRVTTR